MGGSSLTVKECAGVGLGLGVVVEVAFEVGFEVEFGAGVGREGRCEASLACIDERREKVVVFRAWAFSLASISVGDCCP